MLVHHHALLSVCYALAQISLTHVKLPDGKWLLHGKKATGFTNSEEEAVGKTKVWALLFMLANVTRHVRVCLNRFRRTRSDPA